jgi:hypothetical protein
MKILRDFGKIRFIEGYAFPYYLIFGFEYSYKLQIKQSIFGITFYKTLKCEPIYIFGNDQIVDHKSINSICDFLIYSYKKHKDNFFDGLIE